MKRNYDIEFFGKTHSVGESIHNWYLKKDFLQKVLQKENDFNETGLKTYW